MKAASPGWPTCWTPVKGCSWPGIRMKPKPTQARIAGHPFPSAETLRTKHGGQALRLGVRPPGGACARIPKMSSDPASGVGVLTALAAGIVSFLSPCVLPLVPGYLSAVTGVAAADLEKADWRRVIVPSLLFVSSFSVIFILLGLGATGIGSALQQHQLLLDKIAGWLIIAMGRLLRQRPVHPSAQPRVARRGAAGARRYRRTAGRRGRLRHRLDAVHRPHARRHPRAPRRSPARLRMAPSCWPSTRPVSRSPSCSPRWRSPG